MERPTTSLRIKEQETRLNLHEHDDDDDDDDDEHDDDDDDDDAAADDDDDDKRKYKPHTDIYTLLYVDGDSKTVCFTLESEYNWMSAITVKLK